MKHQNVCCYSSAAVAAGGCGSVSHAVLGSGGDVGHDAQAAWGARWRVVFYGVALPGPRLPIVQVRDVIYTQRGGVIDYYTDSSIR